MAKEIFDVTLFNEFTITCGKEKAIITEYLGKQLVNLFQVFLYYREQPVHKDTLIEILWPESDNPISALKFTIHRFERMYKKYLFLKVRN